jgi:hypothetical protein
MNSITDYFGQPVVVGSKVLYTTNARESGLNYGEVVDIEEKAQPRGYGGKILLKIKPLNGDGAYQVRRKYDRDAKEFYETDKHVQPSIINYSAGKIYVL